MSHAVSTSGQSNLTKGRIAATNGRFNRIRKWCQCAPHVTHASLIGRIRIHKPNGISIGSAFFSAQLTAERPYR